MKIITIVVALFISQAAFAQDSTRIFIKAGQTFSEVVTPAVMYRYKEFKPGQVLFNDGTLHNARLNYNLFNAEIMFIATGGDTLAIAIKQALNIKRVSIDTHSYVYDKGYLEVMRENATGTLARRQQYFVVGREKVGAYDMASSTSSIDSYSSISDRFENRYNLMVRENTTLQLKTEYFVGDPYKLFLPVTKRNLEKVFFKQRDRLDTYLRDHSVDFNNEKQLTALFIFLTETP